MHRSCESSCSSKRENALDPGFNKHQRRERLQLNSRTLLQVPLILVIKNITYCANLLAEHLKAIVQYECARYNAVLGGNAHSTEIL